MFHSVSIRGNSACFHPRREIFLWWRFVNTWAWFVGWIMSNAPLAILKKIKATNGSISPSFFDFYLQTLLQKLHGKAPFPHRFLVQCHNANHAIFRSSQTVSQHVSLALV